jgi:hypothetical protein
MNTFASILDEFDCPEINFNNFATPEEEESESEKPVPRVDTDRLSVLEASHKRLEKALASTQTLVDMLMQRSDNPGLFRQCESCKVVAWMDRQHFASRQHAASVHFARFCPGSCNAGSKSLQKRNSPLVRFDAANHAVCGKTVICRSCGWRVNVK